MLAVFAVLVTLFASDLPDMWMRQHCEVPQLCKFRLARVQAVVIALVTGLASLR